MCSLRSRSDQPQRVSGAWGPSGLQRLSISGLGDLAGEVWAGGSAVRRSALLLLAFQLYGLHPTICLHLCPLSCPPHLGGFPPPPALHHVHTQVVSPLQRWLGSLLCGLQLL